MLSFTRYVIALALLAAPVSAQTLDRIRETGELRIGFRTDAAPLSYSDDQGRPAGYSPLVCSNVAQAIANILQMENLNGKFVPVDASNRFDMVANGEIDLLCGAATITLRRLETVDFSVPTYVDGTAVMLPNGASGDLLALAGKKIGVRDGTTTLEAVSNTIEDAGINAEVVAYESHGEGLAAMEAGEINAYFADQSILLYLHNSSNMADKFTVSPEILTIEKQGLAMARGDSDFRLVVDAALSELFASGTMEAIFKQTLPGANPGLALQAMYVTSPTLP